MWPTKLNACWRICGHLEDARDLTQDAFLKAFEHLADFRGESGFYTWIYRTAVNLSLSHLRSARRKRNVSLDDPSGLAGTQAERLAGRVDGSCGNNPAVVAGNAELHGCVVRALQTLDGDYRAVIVLRDIEGLSYRDIASVHAIRVGTVRSRIARGRERLRVLMGVGDE